jgi:transcriptional regulator with XRE-family HTH domain
MKRRSRRKPTEKTLADRVREAMTLAGVSQKQFNREAKLGKGHMSHILSGNRLRPRDGTLEKIVRTCASHGVTVSEDYIRYGIGDAPRKLEAAS